MSAAATPARAPLALEGQGFWQDLVSECKRHALAINAAVSDCGLYPSDFVECAHDRDLRMYKSAHPSIDVKMNLDFHSWGPVISGTISGREEDGFEYSSEEFEIPIAKDLDGSIVAVFDEGRSFSPHDIACYLTQRFSRCYPGVSLPCSC